LTATDFSIDLKRFQAFIFDLDGCVYVGNTVVPKVPDVIEKLRRLGKKVIFVTNNATKSPEEFALKLKRLGVDASSDDVLTSGTATAMYLSQKFGKCKVYPVGGESLKRELRKCGHQIFKVNQAEKADFVVACLDFNFSYKKLSAASRAIRNGKRFIATNIDPVIPVESGFMPGAGAIVSAIVTATGREPCIIGKPSKHMLDMALEKLEASPENTAIVGDRLDTDIEGGNNANLYTILVLSGTTTVDHARNINNPRLTPKLVLSDAGRILDYLS
jgi:4-nitrophenyl phosphatase